MARTIEERLNALSMRRKGADRLAVLTADSLSLESFRTKLNEAETWQKKADGKPYTRYALGAMQEVDPAYTRISLETASRVANQLGKRVGGFDLDFQLQGSVPLNVHIRGISDVDLLTLIDKQFHTYALAGVRGASYPPAGSGVTSLGELKRLRSEEEPALKRAFPTAKVDTSGSKAIKIEGGSLARAVDVVPSHWFDSIDYQKSGQTHERGVIILDRKANTTVTNYPFKHIKLVDERDTFLAAGGLRKAIRLCKNVKADSDRVIDLSSFDIAGIMYHADQSTLRMGVFYELTVLAETQRYLDYLYNNKDEARKLDVPDGTRKIFDSERKLSSLLSLSSEVDELVRSVAGEHRMMASLLGTSDARQVLKEVSVR